MFIKVKATAGARREKVEKIKPDTYAISVKEPKVRNEANNRIRFLLAQELGLPIERVRLISGHFSPTKLLSIRDDDF